MDEESPKSRIKVSQSLSKIITLSLLFADSKVIQVRARDRDAEGDPDNPAGKIVYSIVSTHKHFKIHPETGWLSTNKVSQSYIFCVFGMRPLVVVNISKYLIWDKGF